MSQERSDTSGVFGRRHIEGRPVTPEQRMLSEKEGLAFSEGCVECIG